MPRGGARNRGPLARTPNSEAARARRAGALVLPRAGYRGPVPPFPLPDASEREADVWNDAWRTPQAAAWCDEPWRHRALALWTRLSVRLERDDAPAALGAVVVRLADQVGLTPAGLTENGWRIEEPEDVTARPAVSSWSGSPSLDRARERASVRERLRAADDLDEDPPRPRNRFAPGDPRAVLHDES